MAVASVGCTFAGIVGGAVVAHEQNVDRNVSMLMGGLIGIALDGLYLILK